jgi:hypothetical protein
VYVIWHRFRDMSRWDSRSRQASLEMSPSFRSLHLRETANAELAISIKPPEGPANPPLTFSHNKRRDSLA